MSDRIDDRALDRLFRAARTHNCWREAPVPDEVLQEAYELARMGPTSGNASPMRIVFVRSPEAKARLRPALSAGNLAKTMAAPVTAIIAYDARFDELLPRLFPHEDARRWYAGQPEKLADAGFRNGSLQGAYFILAARALGLDCGPMSGFDNARVDAEFFPDGRLRSNFLVNLGHGDGQRLRPRGPRLAFHEACTIL